MLLRGSGIKDLVPSSRRSNEDLLRFSSGSLHKNVVAVLVRVFPQAARPH